MCGDPAFAQATQSMTIEQQKAAQLASLLSQKPVQVDLESQLMREPLEEGEIQVPR